MQIAIYFRDGEGSDLSMPYCPGTKVLYLTPYFLSLAQQIALFVHKGRHAGSDHSFTVANLISIGSL